ncbi:hypothetical protein ACFO1B_56925, partial [Dactylosporangium siamense]|uniref:hypothetical protein n=1 Tax=Dactylosporangium siamense TaxID=685454 RepID=UPI00361D6CED
TALGHRSSSLDKKKDQPRAVPMISRVTTDRPQVKQQAQSVFEKWVCLSSGATAWVDAANVAGRLGCGVAHRT